MKKFDLRKSSVEISYKNRYEIIEGCSQDQADMNPEIVLEFADKEKALECLKKYITEIAELSGGAGKYYFVTEYYVEENEYDSDDELVSGGDILEFSHIAIEVTNKPDYETVGTFNNFKDAESCLGSLDDGYLSFN